MNIYYYYYYYYYLVFSPLSLSLYLSPSLSLSLFLLSTQSIDSFLLIVSQQLTPLWVQFFWTSSNKENDHHSHQTSPVISLSFNSTVKNTITINKTIIIINTSTTSVWVSNSYLAHYKHDHYHQQARRGLEYTDCIPWSGIRPSQIRMSLVRQLNCIRWWGSLVHSDPD